MKSDGAMLAGRPVTKKRGGIWGIYKEEMFTEPHRRLYEERGDGPCLYSRGSSTQRLDRKKGHTTNSKGLKWCIAREKWVIKGHFKRLEK